MANIKITDLTAYTDPLNTDVLPIVDVTSDTTKKVSIADLLKNAGSGTAAAPGIAFDGDSNTGIYRPGANQLAISTNGTGRLFIDGSGNVTIGAASGAWKLDVPENSIGAQFFRAGSSTGACGIFFDAVGSTDTISIATADNDLKFRTDDGGFLFTNSEDTERLRITSDGKLGLGTSSPAVTAHISSSSAESLRIEHATSPYISWYLGATRGGYLLANSSYVKLGADAGSNNTIQFSNSGGDRLTINSAGNVGIGTTSIDAKLHVEGATPGGAGVEYFDALQLENTQTANVGATRLKFKTNRNGTAGETSIAHIPYDGNGNAYLRSQAFQYRFYNQAGSSEYARIDNSGRLGLGTSSPSALLDVNGTAKFAGQVAFGSSTYTSHAVYAENNAALLAPIVAKNNATNGYVFAGWNASNAQTTLIKNDGSGTFAGQVDAGGNAFGIANTGAGITPTGSVIARRSGTGNIWLGYQTGTTLQTSQISADGSATFAGSVGIGTTSVSAGLHVVTDINPVLKLDRGTANSTNANLYYNGTLTGQLSAANADFQISAAGASTPMSFYVNGSERARIDSSGRLLVGTSSAVSNDTNGLLHVANTSSGNIILARKSTDAYTSGYGIGTIRFFSNSGSVYEEHARIQCFADGDTGSGDKPGRLVFSTTANSASSPTERLRIDSAGDITHTYSDSSTTTSTQLPPGIRINNTDNTLGRLAGLHFAHGGAGTANAGIFHVTTNTATNSTTCLGDLAFYVKASGSSTMTERMRIGSDGFVTISGLAGTGIRNVNVGSSGNLTISTSDERLKENIESIGSTLNQIKQLNPVKYQWKDRETAGDNYYYGFIAQHVEAIFPDCVYENNDGMKGINYTDLIAPLTAALQEALTKIETLEAKVAALEAA